MENLKLYKTQLKLNLFNWQTKVLYDNERGNTFLGADKEVTTFSNFLSCPKSKQCPHKILDFFINLRKW